MNKDLRKRKREEEDEEVKRKIFQATDTVKKVANEENEEENFSSSASSGSGKSTPNHGNNLFCINFFTRTLILEYFYSIFLLYNRFQQLLR